MPDLEREVPQKPHHKLLGEEELTYISDESFRDYLTVLSDNAVWIEGEDKINITHTAINLAGFLGDSKNVPKIVARQQVDLLTMLRKEGLIDIKVHGSNKDKTLVGDRENALGSFGYLYARKREMQEQNKQFVLTQDSMDRAGRLWGEHPMSTFFIRKEKSDEDISSEATLENLPGMIDKLEDPKFKKFMTFVNNNIKLSSKEGYFNLTQLVADTLPYIDKKLGPPSKRTPGMFSALSTIERYKALEIEQEVDGKKKIANFENSILAMSFLYARNLEAPPKHKNYPRTTDSLDQAQFLWGEQFFAEYIKQISQGIERDRDKATSDLKEKELAEGEEVMIGEDEKNNGADYMNKIPRVSTDISGITYHRLDHSRKILDDFAKKKGIVIYGSIGSVGLDLPQDVIDVIRFIEAVDTEKMSYYSNLERDNDVSPVDFRRSLDHAISIIKRLNARLSDKGIKQEITLGDIFYTRRKAYIRHINNK